MSNRKYIYINEIEKLKKAYPEYNKLMSIVRLEELGLPVLQGIVVNNFGEENINEINKWANDNNFKLVSVRFDSTNVADHSKLLSLNIELDRIKELEKLLVPPVIALVLISNNRYTQPHSMLALFEEDEIYCEIVGYGFDTQDITRGQNSPHETIIFKRNMYESDNVIHSDNILSHEVITQERYLKTVDRKYSKIYTIMGLEAGTIHSDFKHLNNSEKKLVDDYLHSFGEGDGYLPETYTPISYEELSIFYKYVKMLDFKMKRDITNKIFSSGFFKKYGFLSWDIYASRNG